jgi:hypothetical protein
MMMVMRRLMMMLRRLMMMLQSRLVVVPRSMVQEWSMEAVADTPCKERHVPSLYAAHGLLIILWMIMIKITWPPTCTCRCLWLIGSVILLGLEMCMRQSRLIKSKVIGEGWLWRSSIFTLVPQVLVPDHASKGTPSHSLYWFLQFKNKILHDIQTKAPVWQLYLIGISFIHHDYFLFLILSMWAWWKNE